MRTLRNIATLFFLVAVVLTRQTKVLADSPPSPPGDYLGNCSDVEYPYLNQGYCNNLEDWYEAHEGDCNIVWDVGGPTLEAQCDTDICSSGPSWLDACEDYCLNYFCPGNTPAVETWETTCDDDTAICNCYFCPD